MQDQKIWQAALGELELTLSRANFTTWFKNTFISTRDEEAIIIGVPNTFTKAWLEKKYHSAILKALQKITGNKVRSVTYQVETRIKVEAQTTLARIEERGSEQDLVVEIPAINEFGLSPKYNFGNFVIGKASELAQAASLAVSQKPGEVYNP